jgi:hypothetical protein
MKTLVYTSIFSNLWGTEFGGRAGRSLHYRHSLLTILNINADKFICFTSREEVDDLEKWFYIQNNISRDKLEFIVFNLFDSKYFDEIKNLKDDHKMMSSDRCYEVQYNKFFWMDLIPNLESYDRIFWIDAGLSHGGIFPEKYTYGLGHDQHFNFSLFNNELLDKLIKITSEKILILSKNNTGRFYWSQTIPSVYYNSYSNKEHIVGGLFGGTVENMKKLRNRFDSLLKELLEKENELYFEELLLSCLSINFNEDFISLKFDDWYDRENPDYYGSNVKYFYNMFEISKICVAAIAIEISPTSHRYLDSARKLIESNLLYTNYDILILTNNVDYFKDITDGRLILIDYDTKFSETIISDNRFNMHLKRYPIKLSQELGYDIIYYNDCDGYIVGWDEYSFENKCNEDFDVAFVSHANPQLGGLRRTYKHFQDIIDSEFEDLYYDELDNAPNPAETRVIFKNNEKLSLFLEFWDKISQRNKNYFTYHDGVYFGTSAIYAHMTMIGITPNEEFSKYCRIRHAEGVLNYFGNKIEEDYINNSETMNTIQSNNNTLPNVDGSFSYHGLQMLQHKNIINVFKHLLSELKPSTIIEIGTEYGGLSLLLQDLIVELGLKTKLRTYDIKTPTFLMEHPKFSDIIEIRTKDLFSYEPFRLSEEGIDEVKEFMSNDGVNLILCDGGNKSKEFNSFSEIINTGDVIMLHDYIIDENEFNENFKDKIWNWHESKLSDIEDSIIKNNLEPYLEDEFSKVVWGSFIKKS